MSSVDVQFVVALELVSAHGLHAAYVRMSPGNIPWRITVTIRA